ncbi:hypothetical protein CAEBREN_02684 [Caenorhabditis brenneri]|uniref:non-specific serine/threonine protein kinase n=1 Tax=Caenorhabditis brenneri TaxID=135651 RepID=G0N516_CAEBE|nr:hypothetical protein CAEBREN_02684 [Caenorhabditis brenneri]
MAPKGIRTEMAGKKKINKSAVMPTTSNQENITPVETTSQMSVAGNATKSRKRGPDAESTSEPQRKVIKKIELVITPSSIEKAENREELDYGNGGYYPVKNGQILNKRYEVQKMLGNGHFAIVHMAEDRMTESTVAVKIAKSDRRYAKPSEMEIKFMERIKEVTKSNSSSPGSKNIVKLLDDFRIKGKEGIHVVMVFEVLCMDLDRLLFESNQQVLTLDRIRKFSKNILEGLLFLHTKCKIMHLDIKPENCLVKVDPHNMDLSDPSCNASLKIGDFGTSAWITDNIKGKTQTCHYRAPEAFLEANVSPLVDVWSVGCVLYEMITRDLLFLCNEEGGDCKSKLHFGYISEMLGPIRTRFFKKDERNTVFFDEVFGKEKVFVKEFAEPNPISPEELMKKYSMTMSEADELCGFMRELMVINPNQRLSAKEALKHPFLN